VPDLALEEVFDLEVLLSVSLVLRVRFFLSSVVLKGLLLLRQCCCHPQLLDKETNPQRVNESCKLDTLKMLVETSIHCGHKILIFSQFTSMLSLIRQELALHKDVLFYLDGSTKNREKIVSDFEKSEKGIFLISIKAGGVGLNLTSAEDVIIFDPWWNPFVEQQAIDRAYRIGQNKRVNVYKLVAANTLEEKIVEMQKEKQDVFDEVINGISENKNIDIRQILKLL
jgi:SNF2 family DNA or RNA helicase